VGIGPVAKGFAIFHEGVAVTEPATINPYLVYGLSITGSALVAALFHSTVMSFRKACWSTAVAVVVVCFIADTIANGRIEGWWLVIMWTLGGLAYATSYAVGWLMDRAGISLRIRKG